VYIDLEGYYSWDEFKGDAKAAWKETKHQLKEAIKNPKKAYGTLKKAEKSSKEAVKKQASKLIAGGNGLLLGVFYSQRSLSPSVASELANYVTSDVDTNRLGSGIYPNDPERAETFQKAFDFSSEKAAEKLIILGSIRSGRVPAGKMKPGVRGSSGKTDAQPKVTVESESASKPYEGKPVEGNVQNNVQRGGRTPTELGKRGEELSDAEAIAAGEQIRGKQVTFELPSGRRTRPDTLTEMKDGALKVREAKMGKNARLSDGQKELKQVIEEGGTVVPRGTRAKEARLEHGKQVRIKHFEEDRYK
jgi:hypothetical protein